jgi:hypothetical protein
LLDVLEEPDAAELEPEELMNISAIAIPIAAAVTATAARVKGFRRRLGRWLASLSRIMPPRVPWHGLHGRNAPRYRHATPFPVDIA